MTDWSARRVLVTGADGFVGSWLVPALLAAGAQVHAIVKPARADGEDDGHRRVRGLDVPVADADVTDLSRVSRLIGEWGIDTVCHLAAVNINTGTRVSPYDLFESNVRGAYTVLEACRTAQPAAGVVIASSKEAEAGFVPSRRRPLHPYMASKASAEVIASSYHDTFEVPAAIVRSGNLYGGGDLNWSRLVPGTVRAVLRGEAPVIRTNGSLQRDYVYVADAVAAYVAVAGRIHDASVAGQTFRVATGVPTSVVDIVRRIIQLTGATSLEPTMLNEASGERVDAPYTPDFERTVLQWTPQYSLDEGLSETVAWYRQFLGTMASA